MRKRAALPIALLIALGGCGEDFIRATSSPGFADGYKDGCANGSSTASNKTGQFVRDEKRYNANPEYTRGWQYGNRKCNGENFQINPNNPQDPVLIEGPDFSK